MFYSKQFMCIFIAKQSLSFSAKHAITDGVIEVIKSTAKSVSQSDSGLISFLAQAARRNHRRRQRRNTMSPVDAQEIAVAVCATAKATASSKMCFEGWCFTLK